MCWWRWICQTFVRGRHASLVPRTRPLAGRSSQGLQACATLTADGDWVHSRKETEVGQPHWTATKLASLLKDFAARKNVPIFNLEIYQDGRFSPASVQVFKEASQILAK